MRFVKVKDEERTGEVAINLDLVRDAHVGGGLLHLYFERSSSAQDDMTFTGENAQKIWPSQSTIRSNPEFGSQPKRLCRNLP